MIVNMEQRWSARRAFFVDPSRRFDPHGWEVASIADDTTAKRFVVATHYSHSYPAARRRFGLYAPGGSLEGVAVFSVPARAAALAPLPDVSTATELGRLVLLDHVGFNAETWFLARCFRVLAAEGFTGVVAFSDPMPRHDAKGRKVFVGHAGQIYAASSAVYLGQRRASTLRLLPDGTVLSARAVSKIRGGERGWRYAVEQLVAHGAAAPARTTTDALAAWLPDALATVTRPAKHPGNHKYVIPFDRATRRALPASLPYPRFDLRGDA